MTLLPSLTSNEIKFIPRKGSLQSVIIRDEQTKEEFSYTPDFTQDGYYSLCTIVHNFIESRAYTLRVLDSASTVLYRGLMFCTTQDVEEYSINKDKYDVPVEDNSNAKYTIINR